MNPTVSTPLERKDLSEAMNRANSVDYNFVCQHYLLNRKPDFVVYLYNVSEQSFDVSRPPILRTMKIPGRKPNERYTLVTSFPCPLLHPKANVDSNEFDIIATDTRRFVMDIINPDNYGLDQDAVIQSNVSEGQNLGARGVFWSLNNPPREDEVTAAVKRMEKHFRNILEAARQVEVSAPAALSLMLTPEHNYAADYFGEERSWHKKQVKAIALDAVCPNCFEQIRSGAAFHKTGEGVLCIIDWQRAIKAGVRTRQQAIDAGVDGFSDNPKPLTPTVPSDTILDVPKE